MSLASISSIEHTSSLFFDSKHPKHLESSENFQNFLANSAFINRPKAPDHPKPRPQVKRSDSIKVLEEVIEYLDPKKRTVTPREVRHMQKPSGEFMESLFSDYADSPSPIKPYYKMSVGDTGNNITSETQSKSRQKLQEVYNRGFDIPKGVSMDKETRQYIEGLHARITGMEREMVRLKKENYELKTQNNKFKETMRAVMDEQEKIKEKKEMYERKMVSLRENHQNNNEMVNSLKRILTLQEEELQERMSRKEENSDKVKPSLLSIASRKTRSSIRVSTNVLRSPTSSIEPIKERPNDNEEAEKQKTVIVRVNTPRTSSIVSVSPVRLKRAVSMKEPNIRGKGL